MKMENKLFIQNYSFIHTKQIYNLLVLNTKEHFHTFAEFTYKNLNIIKGL